jgi:glycolate oxidase iron-sulfur subunit
MNPTSTPIEDRAQGQPGVQSVAATGANAPTPADHGHGAAGPSAAHSHRSDAVGNPGADIDYLRFLDCVHCGLCTAACPTYLELGDENDSPRGRIYLMRAVTDGRIELTPDVERHIDGCLDCRACETACPSGVQYGRLIEPFRVGMEETTAHPVADDWFHRWLLFGIFTKPDRLRRVLLPARIAQRLGVMQALRAVGAFRLLPKRLRQLAEMLPPPQKNEGQLPEVLPAIGRRRARVALFTGCVGDVMFRHVHWATARVLQQNGCDVVVPRDQVCCGAIHFHAGQSEPARQLADRNLVAIDAGGCDAVIVNVAGCGAMLKDYGHHWHDGLTSARGEFADKVKDISQFLDELGLVPPEGEIPITATYHDACHLVHAQRVREAPRKLLASVPGLVLRELPESEVCCGAAGTYNLTQPEMAARLAERKLRNILSTGARAVLTGNAGCLLQIMRQARLDHEPLWIAHPIEVLDMSYRRVQPKL